MSVLPSSGQSPAQPSSCGLIITVYSFLLVICERFVGLANGRLDAQSGDPFPALASFPASAHRSFSGQRPRARGRTVTSPASGGGAMTVTQETTPTPQISRAPPAILSQCGSCRRRRRGCNLVGVAEAERRVFCLSRVPLAGSRVFRALPRQPAGVAAAAPSLPSVPAPGRDRARVTPLRAHPFLSLPSRPHRVPGIGRCPIDGQLSPEGQRKRDR